MAASEENNGFIRATIRLREETAPPRYHTAEIESLRRFLAERHFAHAGDFTIVGTPGLTMHCFVHAGESVAAVVYDQHLIGVAVDFGTLYADGTLHTFSNTTIPAFFDRPPHHHHEIHAMSAEQLYEHFLARRPKKEMRAVRPDELARLLERTHHEVVTWTLEKAEEQLRLRDEIVAHFLPRSGWSADEWEQRGWRVVFIHGRMAPRDVADAYCDALYMDDSAAAESERRRAQELAAQLPPIAAFEKILEYSPNRSQFEKLMELAAPFPAHAYLVPERPEYEDG